MRELINIVFAIYYARKIQTFLWGKPGTPSHGRIYTYEDWLMLMQKRFDRLQCVKKNNQQWAVESRKRALQLAGLAIAFITAINRGKISPTKDPQSKLTARQVYFKALKDAEDMLRRSGQVNQADHIRIWADGNCVAKPDPPKDGDTI